MHLKGAMAEVVTGSPNSQSVCLFEILLYSD